MYKIILKLKEFFEDIFYPNSNLLKINNYPPMNKRNIPKQESVPPMPEVNKPKTIDKIIISGRSNYQEFKELASVFYKEQRYKFVSLSLDKEPTKEDVQFTVEFWSVENE